MSYKYCDRNLLKAPRDYMYSEFEGNTLLSGYRDSRIARLHKIRSGASTFDGWIARYMAFKIQKNFSIYSDEMAQHFREYMHSGGVLLPEVYEVFDDHMIGDIKPLEFFVISENIKTLDLLLALTNSDQEEIPSNQYKMWLDRLVQRFEVTKKIYDTYLPGFRSGAGANSVVKLYWLLGVNLSLYYSRTLNLKYLSTLLKVCDLLCSLDTSELEAGIPSDGMAALMSAEIVFIQNLCNKKGVVIGTI